SARHPGMRPTRRAPATSWGAIGSLSLNWDRARREQGSIPEALHEASGEDVVLARREVFLPSASASDPPRGAVSPFSLLPVRGTDDPHNEKNASPLSGFRLGIPVRGDRMLEGRQGDRNSETRRKNRSGRHHYLPPRKGPGCHGRD